MVYVARIIHKTGFCDAYCAAPDCSGAGIIILSFVKKFIQNEWNVREYTC